MRFSKRTQKTLACIGIPILVAAGTWFGYERTRGIHFDTGEVEARLSALPGVESVSGNYDRGGFLQSGEESSRIKVELDSSATAEQIPVILETYAAAPVPGSDPSTTSSKIHLIIRANGSYFIDAPYFPKYTQTILDATETWFRFDKQYEYADMSIGYDTNRRTGISESRAYITSHCQGNREFSAAIQDALRTQTQVSKYRDDSEIIFRIISTEIDHRDQSVYFDDLGLEVSELATRLSPHGSKDIGFDISNIHSADILEVEFTINEKSKQDILEIPESQFGTQLAAAVREAMAATDSRVDITIRMDSGMGFEELGTVSTDSCHAETRNPLSGWLFEELKATRGDTPPPQCTE